MFQTEILGKDKTYILCSVYIFGKSCSLWGNVGKILQSRTGHKWQYNTTHALCMLVTQGYKYTLRICNTYCFSTGTMFARIHLSVTLCVHRLSCFVPDRDSFITQKSRIYRDRDRTAAVSRNTIRYITSKDNIKVDVVREGGAGDWFRLSRFDVTEGLKWKRSKSSSFLKSLGYLYQLCEFCLRKHSSDRQVTLSDGNWRLFWMPSLSSSLHSVVSPLEMSHPKSFAPKICT